MNSILSSETENDTPAIPGSDDVVRKSDSAMGILIKTLRKFLFELPILHTIQIGTENQPGTIKRGGMALILIIISTAELLTYLQASVDSGFWLTKQGL